MRHRTLARFLAALCLAASTAFGATTNAPVVVREERVTIPTYLAGEPEKNPIFYFGRASQGAEGRVYPYPLYDTLTNRKVDKTYRLVYLENEYVRFAVLPEIGGRLFEGYDKTNKYHFIYRQHVIKPALIGLIGAWISGGVEWNIPHHHRATTFIPVQHRVEGHADGSKTVWVGELEIRHRMRWAVGYTLHPGKSYLEVSVRIVNRTPVAHSMLCFANVAVHANENYQVIFPPSTQWGTHHHKREFVKWPIADGFYGGADFRGGVDVSWYKNHVGSNSIFAWNDTDDFLAGYDHGRQAGLMSVADHHVVPGKKLWTWGNGPRGRMWDKILTDEDGPYIELMVGAYSDNQPDYSWLQPFETRAFEIFWYPFRDIGGAKNATIDAAVNLEVTGGSAKVGFHTTSARTAARVLLKAGERILLDETVAISPARACVRSVPLPAGVSEHDLRASIVDGGRELVAYQPVEYDRQPMPAPVEAPPAPGDVKTVEELYYAGLRIEQFHNPTLDPEPYWDEALRRDPGDVRVHTAYGINLWKKARFADAEQHFRQAIARAAAKYTTPKDAEPIYYLASALKAQGRLAEAFERFCQATWSASWRDAGYYGAAEIAATQGRWTTALDLVGRSLESNARNLRALTLKAALLRRLGRSPEARAALASAARLADPLDARLLAERWLLERTPAAASAMVSTFRAHPSTAAEAAAEYLDAGLLADGQAVLTELAAAPPRGARIDPMALYYLAHFAAKAGQAAQAAEYSRRAARASPDYVFPFQWEAIEVLRSAMARNPSDARAPYYLGNLLFDWQPDEAVRCWELSARLDDDYAVVHRNLAIAWANRGTGASLDKAIAGLEKAVALDHRYALHFAELDALYEADGTPPEKRLSLLEANRAVVAQRDDAQARLISMLVVAGRYDEAISLLKERRFAVWEGGSLDVADSWMDAHLLKGRALVAGGQATPALAEFQAAGNIPENLPAERRGGLGREAEIAYWTGVAEQAAGRATAARGQWTAAARDAGAGRRGENDLDAARSVQRCYQALALARLGESEKASGIFRELVSAAERARTRVERLDFSGSSGERQNLRARLSSAWFVAGLGHRGLNNEEQARAAFAEALRVNPSHLGARTELRQSRQSQLPSSGGPRE